MERGSIHSDWAQTPGPGGEVSGEGGGGGGLERAAWQIDIVSFIIMIID